MLVCVEWHKESGQRTDLLRMNIAHEAGQSFVLGECDTTSNQTDYLNKVGCIFILSLQMSQKDIILRGIVVHFLRKHIH